MFNPMILTLAQDAPPPSAQQVPQAPTNTGSQLTTGEGQPLPASGQQTSKSPGFGDPIMIVALAVLAFMFFFTISSSRKEKKRKAALVSSLKKGSKVRTIGGIVGTIADLRDDNTVVLKVDENTNTRIKFDRNAIASVLEDKAD